MNRFTGVRGGARLPSRVMRVLFVAAECEPWAKTGGLGDVVDALARSLGRIRGVVDGPVEVFLPRYRSVAIPSPVAMDVLEVRVPGPLTDETLIEAERRDCLRRLISLLPERLAEAICLRYFEELSEKEMASRLGVPVGTVKSRLHRARNSFAQRIEPFLN